jgi:restriction system protein
MRLQYAAVLATALRGGKMEKSATSGAALERLQWPWWTGTVLAALAYALLRWIVPSLAGPGTALAPIAGAAQSAAVPIALAFLALSGVSLRLAQQRRRAFDLAMNIAALRALPLERFERFMADALRSEGYAIVRRLRDGVVDFEAIRAGERHLVQCRRWRSETIDIDALRELCAGTESEGAAGCILVTTGGYSAAARRLASGRPVRLIAGRELAAMLGTAGPAAES